MTDQSRGKNGQLLELQRLLESVDHDTFLSLSEEMYKMVADEQRRHLILYLTEQDSAIPLSRMAMELTSRTNNIPITEVTPSQQEQMRISLEHHLLPSLADYGLLSWSYGDDMIEPLPSIDSPERDCSPP
ncbi:DUF7344 domain-containing protein [Haladaptatus sp. NG-WS-4]